MIPFILCIILYLLVAKIKGNINNKSLFKFYSFRFLEDYFFTFFVNYKAYIIVANFDINKKKYSFVVFFNYTYTFI